MMFGSEYFKFVFEGEYLLDHSDQGSLSSHPVRPSTFFFEVQPPSDEAQKALHSALVTHPMKNAA